MRNRFLAVLAFAAAITAGCARNPATGKNELMLVSQSQEIQMGQEYDQQVIQQIGLYPDSAMQRYVREVGLKLAALSERPNLPWTFRVVEDPAVNAFAVPGGHVYITRGIMAHLNSEAELASVVGHEIGHVTARHTAHQMSQQQLAGLGLAIGAIASPVVARYAGVAQQAIGVLFLKFSRDDESQADELGLRYMARGSYDINQMPKIFTMLERQSQAEGGSKLPEWLETHPDPGNRREAIERDIAALPAGTGGNVVNADAYVRRLDGLTFGTNPRDGYFRGTQFLHPGMRFQITFPQGWRTANGTSAVQAMSPQQDAMVELSLAQGNSAETAARTFLSQQGIQAGTPARATLNGDNAVVAPFAAATEQGNLRGTIAFVEHGGGVIQIAGYAPEAAWANNQAAVEGALRTFAPLTDPAALNVQPQKVDIITPSSGTTIADLLRQRPSPLSADRLALINQVDANTPLPAGHPVKWVTGPALPGAGSPTN
jgi:predicted Zn-dependent protease